MVSAHMLRRVVQAGGNLIIEDEAVGSKTLIELVTMAQQSGAHITLKMAYSPETIDEIVRIGGNRVTFRV